MINAFPPKSGIHVSLSPRNIVTGRTLNYNIHFKLPFGDYAQVHENEEPRNSNKERTLGAISLGPIDNAQGGWKFMSLRTGHLLKRYSWDAIPMTQEVIDRVLSFGEAENVPEGIIIRNLAGNVDHNEFEYDDIEGVYDYDLQQNLNPNANNNNPINQIDDGDDSTYYDSDQEDESFNDEDYDDNIIPTTTS